MSGTVIKLCGMMRADDIVVANELLPDYVGFVFVRGRRRYVDADAAQAMRRMLDGRISAVGVFIDETAEAVAELCRRGIIDAVQLHGSEDEDYIARLRTLTDAPIIKAIRVRSDADIDAANASTADMILLDAGTGGGVTFDWSHLERVTRPYILAGGLDCGNVADAIRTLHPYGVDVSSGIETDGVKDADKMRDFVRIVRETV